MAEFQAVMKQAKRMCKQYTECIDCPLYGYIYEICETCPFAGNYEAAKLESVVMDWAEKNPETRYPSWYEWQKTNFPDSAHPICPKTFMSHKAAECDIYKSCGRCMEQPIPAEIAEKLGVKPIEGEVHEE